MAEKKKWGQAVFTIQNGQESAFTIVVSGRTRWALECLKAGGKRGCTPIDTPGPRWSGYVHNLRGLGVVIETVPEAHGGPFSGTHARYVLRSHVERATETGEAA